MDEFDGHYGLKAWVQKYMALATAKPENTLAALHVLKFKDSYLRCIQEVTCGGKWTGRQHHQDQLLRGKTPLQVFVDQCLASKAGINDFELEQSSIPAIRRELVAHLALVLPRMWWHYPIRYLSDNDGENFDQAFKDAFVSTAEQLPPEESEYADRLREFSPFTDTSIWQSVLERACEELSGGNLAELVLPLDGGDSLLRSPMQDLGIDELTSLVWDWLEEFVPGRRSTFKWNLDRLKTAISLYVHPAHLRECEWESVVEAMMADRITSRAIAFVAWKRNQLEALTG